MYKDIDRIDFDEKPAHQVTITRPFWMGVTEVTVAQYRQFDPGFKQGDSKVQPADDDAVSGVTWERAVAFCEWLSRKEGKPYRLPTEAEWEYACRAGTTTAYSFDDSELQIGVYAWYEANSRKSTHPVGQKKPNSWGFYDMHGNVWEWCTDWLGGYANENSNDQIGRAHV